MKKDTIAGNGCGNVEFTAIALQECKATTKQLALYSDELQKAVTRLQKAIDRMPVSMYEIIGSEIIEAGKVINDMSCASGSAHDRRKGF